MLGMIFTFNCILWKLRYFFIYVWKKMVKKYLKFLKNVPYYHSANAGKYIKYLFKPHLCNNTSLTTTSQWNSSFTGPTHLVFFNTIPDKPENPSFYFHRNKKWRYSSTGGNLLTRLIYLLLIAPSSSSSSSQSQYRNNTVTRYAKKQVRNELQVSLFRISAATWQMKFDFNDYNLCIR